MGFYRCGGLVLQLHKAGQVCQDGGPGPRAPHGLPRGRLQLHRPGQVCQYGGPGPPLVLAEHKGAPGPQAPRLPQKKHFF